MINKSAPLWSWLRKREAEPEGKYTPIKSWMGFCGGPNQILSNLTAELRSVSGCSRPRLTKVKWFKMSIDPKHFILLPTQQEHWKRFPALVSSRVSQSGFFCNQRLFVAHSSWKSTDSGQASAPSEPVNWAALQSAGVYCAEPSQRRNRTFFFLMSAALLYLQGEKNPKFTVFLTLRKPRPDRPPAPATQNAPIKQLQDDLLNEK